MRPALLVLALATVSSCASDHDPTAPPARGGRELVVTAVTISPTSFRAGEAARIEVSVTNPSPKIATLCFSSGCTVGWEARDAAGDVVAPGGSVCTANAPCFDLAPHETVTQVFEWQGQRRDPTTGQWMDLPPGTYVVRGGLDVDQLDRISPPVTVELLAR